MYKDYFGLADSPFENTLDQRFLVLSRSHKEVLAALLYFVRQQKSFALVCGDVGTGKTMLINSFLARLPEGIHPILVASPDAQYLEILQYIAEQLNVNLSGVTTLRLIDGVKDALIERDKKGERFILIIDESHLLSDRSLENIRLLSNIEVPEKKLLQILLVGQYELSYKLDRPEMRQVRQRININRFLEPLSLTETVDYINRRLEVVGASYEACFTPHCKKLIYQMTGGIPRRINQLCDNALLFCKALGHDRVNRRVLKKADKALQSDLLLTPDPPSDRRTYSRSLTRALMVTGGYLIVVALLGILGYHGLLGERIRHGLDQAVHSALELTKPEPLNQGLMKPVEIAPSGSLLFEKIPPKAERDTGASRAITPQSGISEPAAGVSTEDSKAADPPYPAKERAAILPSEPFRHRITGLPSATSHPGNTPQESAGLLQATGRAELSRPQTSDNPLPLRHDADDALKNKTEEPEEEREGIVIPTAENAPENTEWISASPRKIEVRRGETLGEIASRWFPENPKRGLDAILLTNPQVTDMDLIHPGQILALPKLDSTIQMIQMHENKYYYSSFARLGSFTELQAMIQELNTQNVKYLVENKVDPHDGVIYLITLGGYDTLDQLKKAVESAKLKEERGETWQE